MFFYLFITLLDLWKMFDPVLQLPRFIDRMDWERPNIHIYRYVYKIIFQLSRINQRGSKETMEFIVTCFISPRMSNSLYRNTTMNTQNVNKEISCSKCVGMGYSLCVYGKESDWVNSSTRRKPQLQRSRPTHSTRNNLEISDLRAWTLWQLGCH